MISDRKRKLIEQYTVSTPRNSNASPTRGTPARPGSNGYTEANRRGRQRNSQDRAHGARAGFSSGSCLLFVRAESRPDETEADTTATDRLAVAHRPRTASLPLTCCNSVAINTYYLVYPVGKRSEQQQDFRAILYANCAPPPSALNKA